MSRRRAQLTSWEYGSLAVLALLVCTAAGLTVTSCGGGGSSDGGLCQQCGDDPDGPCQPSVTLGEGDRLPSFCAGVTPCMVDLRCLRKLGSAQRRCFPVNPADGNLDILFECDGARPNPATITPVPTMTLTPTRTATATATGPTPTGPTPIATPSANGNGTDEFCGNGIVDGDEDCDGSNLDDFVCDDLCDGPGGTLSCNPADCTFDTSGCTDRPCDDDDDEDEDEDDG